LRKLLQGGDSFCCVGFTGSGSNETNNNIDAVMGGNDNGDDDDDDGDDDNEHGMCHRTGISSLFFH
jgi:hypothetical protein